VRDVLSIESSVASRNGEGGTSPAQVARQISHLTERVRDLSFSLGAS
jgi:argininosuccinate lyase